MTLVAHIKNIFCFPQWLYAIQWNTHLLTGKSNRKFVITDIKAFTSYYIYFQISERLQLKLK